MIARKEADEGGYQRSLQIPGFPCAGLVSANVRVIFTLSTQAVFLTMQQRSPALGLMSGSLLACALLAPAEAPLVAQPPLPVFHGKPITLGAAQVAALGRGEAVIQPLETSDPRDVALFGIVAVNVPRAFWVSRFTDFAHSLRPPGAAGFGIFGTPAVPSDAGSLNLSPNDIAALHKCRPGSCQFKLPAAEMAKARSMLDSGGAGAAAAVNGAARARAAEFVNAYRERGNSALGVYADHGVPGVRASDSFTSLMAGATHLSQYAPALAAYLLSTGPRKKPDGATDVIYWVREDVARMRSTVTINHLTVYSPAEHPLMTLAVTKQLYADHYFDGGLDVLVATTRTEVPKGEGIYLMLLRQQRFDQLPSGGMLNLRGRVKAGLRERADAEMRRMRAEYQGAYAPGRP